MWNKINSPIVITFIAIVAVFVLKATTRSDLANEIRGVYEELNSIIEEGASDTEKTKAIQQFAQEIARQIREGFSTGFHSKNRELDTVYLDTKDKIKISGVKYVKSEWPAREKIIFAVKNCSGKYIANLKLNYEYYKKGELIDCENKWVSQIKLLEPNQEIALSQLRSLPKGEDADSYRSDEVKVKVVSFVIKEEVE